MYPGIRARLLGIADHVARPQTPFRLIASHPAMRWIPRNVLALRGLGLAARLG